MKLKLIEPLRDLFKDEVRRIGADLDMPKTSGAASRFQGRGWRYAFWARSLGSVWRSAGGGEILCGAQGAGCTRKSGRALRAAAGDRLA